MAYTNHLLFNNVFLKNLKPSEEEIASANYLVHESARDWYKNADFSTPLNLVNTWIRPLLNQQTLDLVEIESITSTAWYLVAPWEREKPLGICYVVKDRQLLDGIAPNGTLPKGQHWMIQAVNLALENPNLDLRWVIVTNGDQWRLLDTKNLRRYEAFLEIDLVDLLHGKDDWLAAFLFHRIIRLEESFERNESDQNNKLDAFLNQSIKATEVTEKYLKTSVTDNLNTPGGGDGIMAQLCMGLVHAIDPEGKKAFDETERDEIYKNATYLLYRMLFILYAEARNLLPMNREDYQAISLNRLVDEAYAIHLNPGKDVLQQTSLWNHLKTLFNAIQYSDEYIGIPPYNGGLFESEDKPYLENYKISNRYLAEALVELVYLMVSEGETPPDRIDYRDLSVRHLGSLYEGMIEYRLFIAEEELLARRDKDGKVKYLSLAKNDQKTNDEILQKGKVYFAQSPHERKATGTHYTAEDLVERLVKQTVMRLLDERWQEFETQLKEWQSEIDKVPGDNEKQHLQSRVDYELKQFVENQILSITACDPAMGSGHFLVHIAHQMTNFTLCVLSKTNWKNVDINLNADVWRKRIVENCLYGVDINQMAVELAKLSLWLATMQLGQPLSFLDHHLKVGNSLLGASLEEIEAILEQDDFSKQTAKSTIAESKGQYMLVKQAHQIQQKIGEANTLLQKITNQIVTRAEDIHQQEFDYEEVEKILAPYKRIGDLIVAQKMVLKIPANEILSLAKAWEAGSPLNDSQASLQEKVKAILLDMHMHPLHWGLEFPIVFLSELQKGFDIVVGNPPFLGGLKISTEMGDNFSDYLQIEFSPTNKNVDLCTYFLRKSFRILNITGIMGFVTTNTISQGDTRSAGLMEIIKNGGTINFAKRFVRWGGDANVEVNLLCVGKTNKFTPTLDENPVPFISSWLDDLPEYLPAKLVQNNSKSFVGHYVCGSGFLIDKNEYLALINSNKDNQKHLRPYIIGREINENVEEITKRYAICFENLSFDDVSQYPELLTILRERVKPKRDKLKVKSRKEKWWLFAGYYKNLQQKVERMSKVLIRSRVSELHTLKFIPTDMLYSDATVIFAFDDYYHFALLQSWIHESWLRRQASTMRTDIRYTPTDCFQTFPFPQSLSENQKMISEQEGKIFYEYRQQIMQQRQLGLTKTYNLFNDPTYQDEDIQQMRILQARMDQAILVCYDWDDIDMQHDFYPNDRKKIRFMPSPEAQREIFNRLIALNQEIAAKEAEQGLVIDKEEDDEIQVDLE